MYFYVQFVDDKKRVIVDEDAVLHLDKANIDQKKKYKVRWEDGEYYYAVIMNMHENITKLKEIIDQKRQRIYNQNLLYSSSRDSDESSTDQDEVVIKRTNNEKPEQPYKEILHKIVKEKLEKKKVVKKTNEIINDNNLNEKKIEKKNKEQDYNNLCQELERTQQKVHRLEAENENLIEEMSQLRKLNMELQEEIINKFKGLSTDALNPKTQTNNVKVGQKVGENIHIGQDVYIPISTYNSIKTLTDTPQQFVKAMAVAVFGSLTLAQSSVRGKSSNRSKSAEARPALDSTKLMAIREIFKNHLMEKNTDEVCIDLQLKNTGMYIARKIADLNRPKAKNPDVGKNPDVAAAVEIDDTEDETGD